MTEPVAFAAAGFFIFGSQIVDKKTIGAILITAAGIALGTWIVRKGEEAGIL